MVAALQAAVLAARRHPTLLIKDFLACVYNLKVISQQAMPPNQFHRLLASKSLLYRGVLLCLN